MLTDHLVTSCCSRNRGRRQSQPSWCTDAREPRHSTRYMERQPAEAYNHTQWQIFLASKSWMCITYEKNHKFKSSKVSTYLKVVGTHFFPLRKFSVFAIFLCCYIIKPSILIYEISLQKSYWLNSSVVSWWNILWLISLLQQRPFKWCCNIPHTTGPTLPSFPTANIL